MPLLGSVNYSMVATVTAAAVDFANNPTSPFVFPNVSSAASAEDAVPPGTLDFRRANQIDMRIRGRMQWSVTVERDLGRNGGARVSYVGSNTTDLILESGSESGAVEHARLRSRARRRNPFPDCSTSKIST